MILVNSRQYTNFSPIETELTLENDKNYCFDLSYLAVLKVGGTNAKEFLQGQLTCDLREISDTEMRFGAQCNLKGRVLALVDVIQWNEIFLILPNDLLKDTLDSLGKTAMFSKVKLEPQTAYHLFGFYLQNQEDSIPFDCILSNECYAVTYGNGYCCYHIGDGFYIFIVENNKAQDIETSFIKSNQYRGSIAWHELQLKHKRFEIYPESRGLFLPHRLGLQNSGHIHFNKGCYKGQEIIARTHYLAKLKHAINFYSINSADSLQSGQKLISDTNAHEIGELIDYCPTKGGQIVIAASILSDHQSS